MNQGQPPLSYRQLMTELRRFCAEKRTGTMFITTTENQSARFVLRQGNIISMWFRLKGGVEALPFIKRIENGWFSFTADVVDHGDHPVLPPTRELLTSLTGESIPLGSPHSSSPINTLQLDRAQKAVESELAEFLGPMASVICREYLLGEAELGQPPDITKMIEAISKEVGDPVKEVRFKQRVLAKLSDSRLEPRRLSS